MSVKLNRSGYDRAQEQSKKESLCQMNAMLGVNTNLPPKKRTNLSD